MQKNITFRRARNANCQRECSLRAKPGHKPFCNPRTYMVLQLQRHRLFCNPRTQTVLQLKETICFAIHGHKSFCNPRTQSVLQFTDTNCFATQGLKLFSVKYSQSVLAGFYLPQKRLFAVLLDPELFFRISFLHLFSATETKENAYVRSMHVYFYYRNENKQT